MLSSWKQQALLCHYAPARTRAQPQGTAAIVKEAEVSMGLTEHTLVFVQELSAQEGFIASTGMNWEVRTSEQHDKTRGAFQRIFVVPVCSAFSLDAASYHHFLYESGALEEARGLLEKADLQTMDGAMIARKEVQACIVAAEVESILDGYCVEA
jgi:hypothetical protein